MTDEQINAAIARACGWIPDCDRGICWDQYGNAIITPPNYCADLNAMRKVEQYVEDRNKYLNILADLTKSLESASVDNDWFFCRATARERAEAFLRTLGKWEEGK